MEPHSSLWFWLPWFLCSVTSGGSSCPSCPVETKTSYFCWFSDIGAFQAYSTSCRKTYALLHLLHHLSVSYFLPYFFFPPILFCPFGFIPFLFTVVISIRFQEGAKMRACVQSTTFNRQNSSSLLCNISVQND